MKALGAALVLVLSILALGAGTAQAITATQYEVTVEGEAAYARTDTYAVQPAGSQVDSAKARFKWKSRWPSVTFFDKKIHYTSEPSTQVSDIAAAMQTMLSTPAGTGTGACSGTTLAEPASGAWLGAGVIPTPDPSVESLDLRVLGGARFHLPSCSGLYAPGPGSLGVSSDNEIPFGAFDQAFDLPHEAIGMGKIIQLLDANVGGEGCPGHHEHTTSCALTWKATVTFVRTGQWQTAPAPPSEIDESMIPAPPVQPNDGIDERMIPMPPPRAKLSRDGRRAELSLSCPVACKGTAAAYPAARGARASAAKPLAAVRFKGAAGRPTKVVLRLGSRARRAIERVGGVRIELRISPEGGSKVLRRSVVIRLGRSGR